MSVSGSDVHAARRACGQPVVTEGYTVPILCSALHVRCLFGQPGWQLPTRCPDPDAYATSSTRDGDARWTAAGASAHIGAYRRMMHDLAS